MNRNEIIDLLSIVVSYDNRKVGETTILSWSDAAVSGRWTFDEAARAARDFLNTRPDEWLKPGHVGELVRARRSDRANRDTVEVRRDARLNVALETVGDLKAIEPPAAVKTAESTKARRSALSRPCPWCRSQPQKRCTKPTKYAPDESGRVEIYEPHPGRVALNVVCPSCSAGKGEVCTGTRTEPFPHPHLERERAAIGPTGLARRADHVKYLRQISANPDWTREPEIEEPPDDMDAA